MTAIDDFLVGSRRRVNRIIDFDARQYTLHPDLSIKLLAEIHSVLTVIAQNMPCNVEANDTKNA